MDQTIPKEITSVGLENKQFTGIAAKLIKLLGIGCSQTEAALACGVSDSYVAQYMADADFVKQVNEELAKTFAEQSVIDENYRKVEKTLSDRLLKVTEFEFNADRILRTLKFVNEAKLKMAPKVDPSHNGANGQPLAPVVLLLPVNVSREFIVNPQNEIIGINGRELTTVSSKGLEALAIEAQKNKENSQQQRVKLNHGPRQTDPYGDL